MTNKVERNEYTFFAVPSREPYVLTKEMQTEELKQKVEESRIKFLELMNKMEQEKKLELKKK